MKQRLWALILGLAFLLGASGCAGLIYTNPGPNPARLTVPVKASVPQAKVDEVIDWFGGPLHLNSPPHFDTIEGPFWDVQAFILAPDGGLHQLPPVPGKGIWNHEGLSVEGEAQFLAPPGKHQLRLILSSSLLHVFYDDFGKWEQWIYIFNRYDTPRVELFNGQDLALDGLLKAR